MNQQRYDILSTIRNTLIVAPRIGADKDEPEGLRYIQLSDTIILQMINGLTEVLELEIEGIEGFALKPEPNEQSRAD